MRDVLEEKVPTFFEIAATAASTGTTCRHRTNSSGSRERDNWGQLYLYDPETGKLKNQITTGEGNVTQLLQRGREEPRSSISCGVGREKGRDPYFIHFYRVGFDGKNLKLLTPEDGNHDVTLSPSGKYFVDSYSKPDVPPVAVLRDDSTASC